MKMQDMHSAAANHLVLTNFMSFGLFMMQEDCVGCICQFREAQDRNGLISFYHNYLLNILRRDTMTKKGGEERAELISSFINV